MFTIKKILVVDDDSDIRELIVAILKEENFMVDSAVDGADAKAKIINNPIDLLITDFNMPNMNGVELLNWCREGKYHFPVIFVTANRRLFSNEEVALSDCCAALLKKPIDLHELLEAIRAAEIRNHKRDCPD